MSSLKVPCGTLIFLYIPLFWRDVPLCQIVIKMMEVLLEVVAAAADAILLLPYFLTSFLQHSLSSKLFFIIYVYILGVN